MFKRYYGRGPLQLTWNYNYGQVSRAIFGDNRLLNDPDMVRLYIKYYKYFNFILFITY